MAFGMRPVRRLSGTDYQGDQSPYEILKTQTAIGYLAPVTFHTDGTIKAAAAGDDLLGSFMGCHYSDNTGVHFSLNWPGSNSTAVDIVAQVADSPDLIFEIETNTDWGVVDAPAAQWRGLVADIYVPGTAVDANGQSLVQISEWVEGAGEGVLKTYRVSPKATLGSANQVVEVIIVQHALLSLTSRSGAPAS